MSRMISGHHGSWLPEVGEWGERLGLAKRRHRRAPSPGLLVAGMVVVGLGFLVFSHLGPDVKRYLKIHNM